MPTITIDKLSHQHVLTDDEFYWLKDHLGEPLQVRSICFLRSGRIHCITVAREDTVFTLFHANGILATLTLYDTKILLDTRFGETTVRLP